MRASRFNVALPNEPRPRSMLLYNALTQAFVELDADWRRTYERLTQGVSDFSRAEEEQLAALQGQGFMVEDPDEELALVAHRLRGAQYRNDGTYRATIVTTMACNLACVYCVESGVKRDETMRLDMGDKAFAWITRQAKAIPTRRLAISFYGGEPLLNLRLITDLAKQFQSWAKCTKRTFGFTLSTNGTLLTRDVVEELLPLGLQLAQVSMDGIREVHDKRRPFKSGRASSFDVILCNLADIADLLPVTLAGCYDAHTVDQIPAFLALLEARGLNAKLEDVQFDLESPFVSQEGVACHRSGECGWDAARDLALFLQVRRELMARGFGLRRPVLGPSGCAMVYEHGHAVIAPDGTIYKCNPLLGQPECAVGHVNEKELRPRHACFMSRELWRACLEKTDCPYVYLCGPAGGCRYRALLKEGDLWARSCEREHLDQAVPALMRLEYERLERLASVEAGPAGRGEISGQHVVRPVASQT